MPGSWAFSLEYRLQPARAQYTLKAEHLPRSVPTAHVPKNRSIRFADRNEPLRIGSEGHGGDRTAQEQKIVDAGLTPERETIDRRKQRRLARRSVHDRGVRAGGPGGKEASRSGREAAPASRNPMRPICWPMRPS